MRYVFPPMAGYKWRSQPYKTFGALQSAMATIYGPGFLAFFGDHARFTIKSTGKHLVFTRQEANAFNPDSIISDDPI